MPDSDTVAEQLENLRQQLSELTFNPDKDSQNCKDGTAEYRSNQNAYLRHYGLASVSKRDSIRYFLGTKKCNGYTIACQYWLPEAPSGTVFVVHGYFDHTGLYGHLFNYLLDKNLAVVAFDLPGHGLSDGERVSIASFDHYVEVFDSILKGGQNQLPLPWHAVGQSTGGAIVLKHLLTESADNHTFSNIALLAPLLHPYRWQGNRLLYSLAHRFLARIKRNFTKNSGDQTFVDFIVNQDPLQAQHIPLEWIGAMKRWTEEFHDLPNNDFPLRIIQGDCDITLDWRYNLKQLRRKLPSASITMVAGAQHHLVNETKVLRDQTFELMGFE